MRRRDVLVSGLLVAVAVTLLPTTAFAKSTTTTAALDYRSALTKRFAREYGDAALAQQVVTGLSDATITSLEAKVPAADVAMSPFLAYKPPRVAADKVDGLVVFAFGNRLAANGELQPGPTNEALAKAVEKFVAEHPLPVYAQTEIAQQLQAAGVQHVTSIDPVTNAAVPKGVTLPTVYDLESNQSWSRTRAAYLPTDLIGRLTTL